MEHSERATEPIILCEHVAVAYGRQEVLHDVNVSVRRGALLPFIGPNGAGKTTLLRAILGLLRPKRGRIVTPFEASPPGYVPQQKAIDPVYPVSVRQIVAMGLYPQLGWRRRPNAAQRALIASLLERFGLAEHADKTFAELSGGMKQKTMIARALASRPEVLIMDEPTSELDERSEQEVLRHLSRLVREEGKTVLLAHHGLEQAGDMAREVCLVDHGRARLAGTDELRAERGEGGV